MKMKRIIWYNTGKNSIPLRLHIDENLVADALRMIRQDLGEHAPPIESIRVKFKNTVLNLNDELPNNILYEKPLEIEYTPDLLFQCNAIGKMVQGRTAIEATIEVEKINGVSLGLIDVIIDTGSEYPLVVPISLIKKWNLIQVGLDFTEGTGVHLKIGQYQPVKISMKDDEIEKKHHAIIDVFSIIGVTNVDGKYNIQFDEKDQIPIIGLLALESLRLWVDSPNKTLRRMYPPRAPQLISKSNNNI